MNDTNQLVKMENNLRLYISAWAWHILAIVFLSTLIFSLLIGNIYFTIALAFIIGFCEYKALARKWELLEENE